MKNLKKYIHIYITTVSMAAFLTGWSFLAHAPKPAAVTTASAASTTQTITSASSLQTIEGLLNITPRSRSHRNNTSSSFTTTLRTAGS